MKILMPGRILERNVGGNTTYGRQLRKGLREEGFVVDSINPARSPIRNILREQRESLGAYRNYDLLHFLADTGLLIDARIPTVTTVHGVASLHENGIRNPRQERIWRARVSRAIEFTDEVVTVSESSKKDIAELFDYPDKNITVIQHGIDHLSTLNSDDKLPGDESSRLGRLPSNFALYLGNIEPRKNLVELVRAFDLINKSGAQCPLVIAGKPAWDAQASLDEIERSPHTIYLGFVSDAARTWLYQQSSLFVFPSLYEGFGFPVLEAQALGTPVVCSSRGSLAEVAGPAHLMEDLTAEGMAADIEAALSDPTGACGRPVERVAWAQSFTWQTSVRKHIELYSDLMGE